MCVQLNLQDDHWIGWARETLFWAHWRGRNMCITSASEVARIDWFGSSRHYCVNNLANLLVMNIMIVFNLNIKNRACSVFPRSLTKSRWMVFSWSTCRDLYLFERWECGGCVDLQLERCCWIFVATLQFCKILSIHLSEYIFSLRNCLRNFIHFVRLVETRRNRMK